MECRLAKVRMQMKIQNPLNLAPGPEFFVGIWTFCSEASADASGISIFVAPSSRLRFFKSTSLLVWKLARA